MSREAMQAALDALIESFDAVHYEYTEALRLYEGIPTRKAKLARMKALVDKHESAIEQLEAALAAPEQEPVAWRYQASKGSYRYRSYVQGFDRDYAILKPIPLYAAPVSGRVISDAEIAQRLDDLSYLNDLSEYESELLSYAAAKVRKIAKVQEREL